MIQSLLSLIFASQLNTPFLEETGTSFDDRTLLEVNPLPIHSEYLAAPTNMSAQALYASDIEANLLYEENSQVQRPIASLTKLMTAAIILEENNFSELLSISENAAETIGSSMDLYEGEQINLGNVLTGLLVRSGNDAAVALAEHNAGSVPAFVDKMNEKAQSLGLTQTHYKNPTGLDQDGAYSTAKDQAMLTLHLLNYPTFREIVNKKTASVSSESGHVHELVNTNILLGQMGIHGVKTGSTGNAGECLISLGTDPEGQEIITVVLGSENRFPDTKIFLDWLYQSFSW
jgi:D-alanyl-D-alanine carboxypeptidase (penicillin-binding protein 5/6)